MVDVAVLTHYTGTDRHETPGLTKEKIRKTGSSVLATLGYKDQRSMDNLGPLKTLEGKEAIYHPDH